LKKANNSNKTASFPLPNYAEILNTKKKLLTRDIIIQALVKALKPLDYAHAFYEGGAIAFNRIDEWSDIDLYLVVDDQKVKNAFLVVEKALKSLSPIKQKLEIPQTPWPGVSQVFYKLKNTSDYLLIDFVVLKLSSEEKFLEPKMHGKAVFYFNKSGRVKLPPFDNLAFVKKVQERIERFEMRLEMFNVFVQKEINRGNYLEALDLYHAATLATLTEALRIKHNPVHHEFKTRYIHYELPPKTVERLKQLSFVKDEKDLQKKFQEATRWCREVVSEIAKMHTAISQKVK